MNMSPRLQELKRKVRDGEHRRRRQVALEARRPHTFHAALQALRLLHAVVWLGGHYHVGLGRFDQYMWPYLQADLQAGRETIASMANAV